MITRILLLFSLVLGSTAVLAQGKSYDISGTLNDTLDLPLASGTVLLLNPSDSTMIAFARTNEKGEFTFSKVKAQSYLVKATYVGFIPTVVRVAPQEAKLNLGIIRLKPVDSELFEVVIKTAKAPMIIRGDTIEYDATTFKAPPGATVEDLLRRLPGVEVDATGAIKVQGRDVSNVTVDGKQFFGNDPKMATKNLPAEGISKVQVFDRESEEKKLTGISSAPTDKTINLKMKEGYKKGSFGKLVAGYGYDDRGELKANFNRFNDKLQFSALGVANNTGRNGLGWDDYQDFKGSQSWNWDNGSEFGFGGGNMGYGMRFMIFDEDEDETSSLMNSFFGNNQNGGFPKNANGGINANYEYKKAKLNGLLFSEINGVDATSIRNQQNFLPENTYYTNDNSTNNRLTGTHRFELKWEQEIDSLTTLIVSANGSYKNTKNNTTGTTIYRRQDLTQSNQTNVTNDIKSQAWALQGNFIFRKKFKHEGRAFALSGSYFDNDNNKDNIQASTNTFYDAQAVQDSVYSLSQLINTQSNRAQTKANAMYVEPLSKKFFIQSFYNFNYRDESGTRDVRDVTVGGETPNDYLSRTYSNQLMTNRLGTSLRYSHKGWNISTGVAFQRLNVAGTYAAGPSANINGEVNRSFDNWLPNVNISTSLKRNRFANLNYSVTVNEPSVRNLQPIIDNSNPLFIKVGNPSLIPQTSHTISGGFNTSNTIKFTNFQANVSLTYYLNQFISTQNVDSMLVTTSQTINYSGGNNANAFLNYSFPIVKNAFTVGMNYNHRLGNSFAFVNDIRNRTFTQSYSPGLRLSVTPLDFFALYLNANVNIADTRYDINTSQNQVVINQTYSAELNARLGWKMYLNSRFNYNRYENSRFGFSQNVPIWNISIYKIFMKNNRGELRLSVYDLFNRNLNVQQTANANLVSETRTSSLSRYFILSFTYNIRGINAEIKKNNRFGG